jgi:two-component system, OmpR family, sensor kinase
VSQPADLAQARADQASSSPRRWWSIPTVLAAATPALVGGLVALVVRVQDPTTDLVVETRLWIAVLVAGLLVSAVLAGRSLVRRRLARAWASGAAEAEQSAQQDHHRFLLRLDHELKNPVTAIRAGLANLAATPTTAAADSSATTAGPIESISAQTQRLSDLVADLRKLAELETRPLERAPVDLTELLQEVDEAVGELPGARDRTVALTLPQAPWPLGTIPGDRDLLFLALHNLLVNALKFTQPGDRIEVRARDDGEQVVVEVADTGVGIPSDEVGHIWEELARGSAARGTPGMGLGLALVRVVVARHGGVVWVRSRVGYGTVVGVGLPLA